MLHDSFELDILSHCKRKVSIYCLHVIEVVLCCRYGYVEFESVEDASNAKKTCKSIEIDGRSVRVEYSYTGQEREGRGKGGGSGDLHIQ